MRARLHIIGEGPLIAPIRRCPSSTRCRVAASPPCQLVAPMDGTSAPGSPAGSITTNGMDRLVSSARWDSSSPDSTRITPCGRRAATWSAQVRPGVSRPGALAQHHAQPGVPGHVLHPPDDLHRPGALQLVEDQVDQRRAGRLGPAAPVAVGAQQLLDAGAGGRGDVGPAVEHLRNSRRRDAGLAGDLGEGRGLASGRVCLSAFPRAPRVSWRRSYPSRPLDEPCWTALGSRNIRSTSRNIRALARTGSPDSLALWWLTDL